MVIKISKEKGLVWREINKISSNIIIVLVIFFLFDVIFFGKMNIKDNKDIIRLLRKIFYV